MSDVDICSGIKSVIDNNLQGILSKRYSFKRKPDSTLVSEGDYYCEQLVTNYLKSNLADCSLISEESFSNCHDISGKEYVITLDPIDGTENFVTGLSEWGVGVSVYRHNVHIQSMIYMPEMNRCLKSGDLLGYITQSRICGISSYVSPSLLSTLSGEYEYRIMGCCMYNMYNVIKGSYCRFSHLSGAYSWDILPGINLALEHGLRVEINGVIYRGEFLIPGEKYYVNILREE